MVVDWPGSWSQVGESWLAWLVANAAVNGWLGFDVGDMPDSIWALHAMYEPVVTDPVPDEVDDGIEWCRDPGPAFHRLRWQDFAQRSGGPLVLPGWRPSLAGALPGRDHDAESWDLIHGPCEGSMDLESWRELMQILEDITGPDTICTAYYVRWASYAEPNRPEPPFVFRGRLDDIAVLTHNPTFAWSPQNVWPDDHSWVTYTDYDLWATRVSASTEILHRLSESPILELARLPDVPKPEPDPVPAIGT
jgi:hypothetical protein